MFARGIARILFAGGDRGVEPPTIYVATVIRPYGASGTPPPTNKQRGCNLYVVLRRGQDLSLRNPWGRGRRGEQCSPGRFSGSVRLRGRAMLAPTTYIRLDVGGGVPDAPCNLMVMPDFS